MRFLIIIIILFPLIGFNQNNTQKTKPKIGLTLSGGGAKGLAHIGVLKVLEEAGIRPDYITGTSMGSIIGGLYAIGYSPAELEYFVKNTDWDKLMNDYISRRDLAMTEKEYFEKYILDLPIEKKKKQSIKIQAAGMHSGFNIMMKFIELTERAEGIEDFSKFEIPFTAVAADIEHGESVLLTKGSLALAMRASMAIPSVFTPVLINDTLLVDGGLLNNFPVKEVKDMGADIVIGVDVQGPFYKQDDLYSVLNIFQQSSKILRKPLNDLGKSLTDYYVQPEVSQFSVMGFDDADTIIKLGEAAGRKMLEEFKLLAKKYNYNYVRKTDNTNETTKIFKISEIKINGLKDVTRKHVIGRLKIDTSSFVSYNDIENAIIRLRGSQYFSSIYFYTKYNNGNTILTIDVVEKTGRQFKVGINYNTISRASVLLSYVSRNLLAKGSRLELTAKVGQDPGFFGNYLIDNGWKPGLGFSVKAFMKEMAIYNYPVNSPYATFSLSNLTINLYTQSTFYNVLSVGGGIEYEGSIINEKVTDIQFDDYNRSYVNAYGFIKFDNLDRLYFPNKGFIFNTTAKLNFEENYDPRFYFIARYAHVIPIVKNRLNFILKLMSGTNIGEDIPAEYLFTTNEYIDFPLKSFVPFVGLRYNQVYSQTASISRLDLRYQIFKNNYITITSNVGAFTNTYEDLINYNYKDYTIFGMGISYSVQTLIGPITLGFSESDYTHAVFTYFSLGYQF